MPPTLFSISSGFAVWVVGALVALFNGAKVEHRFYSTLLFIGGALLLAGVLLSQGNLYSITLLSPFYFGLAPFATRLDALASLFLALLAVLSCAVAFYSPGYLAPLKDRLHGGIYWNCMFLFLLSMGLVILSANAISFLIFWEIMSLSSVALVASDHVKQRSQRAALIYLGATTISSALLTGTFLWYHQVSNSWNFTDWHTNSTNLAVPLLLFVGIAIKAGVWPFHIWMPYAQPEAPAPVAALMSGIMKKVAIYALIRILILNGEGGVVLGYLALLLGTVSAAWGVLFALLERDLKRLLTYSTVENVGLILIALSLTILCKAAGLPGLAAIAIAAALFHCVNHGMFKTLLFLGAGSIETSMRSRDLSILGGLGKKMPYTMVCFLIGSLAISALPPLNGFSSKWLIYQSLFQFSFMDLQVIDRALALVIVGILSFVGALSLACYAKAVGICFIGKPRSDSVANVHECTKGMIVAQVLLAGSCILLGLLTRPAMSVLAPSCHEVVSLALDPVALFRLPMIKMTVIGALTVWAVYLLLFNRQSPILRKYITWDCGYGDLPARAEETGTSFSEPIARMFGPLLQYRKFTEIIGRDRRHFPEAIKFETATVPILEQRIYGPTIKALQYVSKMLANLQTGSIHLYLMYVFVTLLILVGIGVRL